MALITVEQLRQKLETVKEFPVSDYIAQLQERVRTIPDLAFLQAQLGNGLPQEQFKHGDHLSSSNAQALIYNLGQSVTAWGLASMHPEDDPYNFRGCVEMEMARAIEVDALTRLTGYCFADHIDEHLVNEGLPKLATLQQDAAFVAEYQATFLNPDTVDAQIDRDMLVGNTAYSSSMLFVSNYFQHEATPTLHEPSQIWLETFGQIAQAKVTAAVQSHWDVNSPEQRYTRLVSLALTVAKSLSVAYAPQSSIKSTLLRPPEPGEVIPPLAGMVVPENVKQEIDRLLGEHLQLGDWKTSGEQMVIQWDRVASTYKDAVRSVAMVETAHYETFGMIVFIPMPTTITTTRGQVVVDWINRTLANFSPSYPGMVVKGAPGNTRVETKTIFGSCFVAGTQIITRNGVKNIEDLEEFDWVLTRGEFNEWGLVSDERVVIPVEMPTIHGFNHEKPFFTAGHVFFTTTGLRALDPIQAMRENPWADIGRLAVGNIVMRLNTATEQYEQVVIQSISTTTMPDVKQVYGVHLREGRRSYHANGYLVAVNYPEITMKSVCKMLRTIPAEEQARMLLAFKELRPLFERFGIGAIADAVRAEAEEESEKHSMRLYKTKRNKLTGPGHGSFQYPPEEIVGFDYSGLLAPLPTVSVLEGVVFVNGVACERAAISNMKNEIRWMRNLSEDASSPTGPFEHGRLIVNTLTHAAEGDIVYSEDATAQRLLDNGFIQFLAMAEDLSSLPSYEEALAAAVPVVVEEAQPSFAMAALELRAPPPEFRTTDAPVAIGMATADAVTAAPLGMAAEMADAANTAVDNDPLFLPPQPLIPSLRPMRFNMVYDMNRLKKNQLAPTSTDDLATFGAIDLVTGRSAPTDLTVRRAMLPALDSLHQIITAKFVNPELGQLGSFYTSAMGTDGEGRTTVSIKIVPTAQELLSKYRDKRTEDDDSLAWTFKKVLDTDVTLGMMFHTIEATIGPDGKMAMGVISEYSSDSDTGEGTKHLFMSKPGDTANRVDIDKRLEGSRSAGGINTGSPTTPVSTPQKPPPVREGPMGSYHVNTLDNIPYSTTDVEEQSRAILQNIMHFHMETSDLNEIFNKRKPDNLPQHLAEGLESDLKDWIKNTYGPAYTALTIAESYNTKDWIKKFTEKERAKILFFWQGDRPGCLSQSLEYKRINKLAVRQAMLQLYKVLEQFVGDNGKKWSGDFYDQIVKNELENTVDKVAKNNQTALEKYCNILYVLDPDTMYAKEFYQDVVEMAASATSTQVRPLNEDMDTPWMFDACRWMADALLDPSNTKLNKDVRDAFMKEYEEFIKAQGLEDARQDRDKFASSIMQQVRLAANASKALGAVTIFAKGIWYRSTTQITKGAWLQDNDLSKGGSKIWATFKVLALTASMFRLFYDGAFEKLQPSEIAKISATIVKNTFDIISPHLTIRTERNNIMVSEAEVQIMNDKVRKTPFGIRRGALVEEKVKYMEKLGEESLKLERGAEQSQGFLKRLQNKMSMSANVVRLIGVVIAVAFISFMIWDMAVHGGKMSGGQLALGIINIILEVAIVVIEIVAVMMPALSIIPVIGQLLAVAVLVVGLLLMLFGGSEHQETPGEKFVGRMQQPDGWVTKLNDPPEALLTSSLSSWDGIKGTQSTYTFTLANQKSIPITFTEATKDKPGTPESTDTINSVEVSFFAGSDESALYSNGAFAGPGETVTFGSGAWSFTAPGAAKDWNVALLKPNGTSLKSTNYVLRLKAADGSDPKTAPKMAPGETLTFTITGALGAVAGTTIVKTIERRPGASFCPVTYTVTRN